MQIHLHRANFFIQHGPDTIMIRQSLRKCIRPYFVYPTYNNQAERIIARCSGAHVNQATFSRDNHYVPRSYLNRWTDEKGRLCSYRLLVSHPNVPLWKLQSTRSLAYHEHLYTRVVANGETGEFERWIGDEFESPAKESIDRAVSSERLSKADWGNLIRFVAAQDARTPARLLESLKRWYKTLPALVDETLEKSVKEYEATKRDGASIRQPLHVSRDDFPSRITLERESDQEGTHIRFETVAGRALWIFSLKQLLTSTVNILLGHKWTILRAPTEVEWLTSDKPVIRLNYRNPQQYDFGGGWGSKGTEIFLPLSPSHLMYTQIGKRPPDKGHIVDNEMALSLQRFIIENAHRFVFARTPNSNVAVWRPRTVDKDAFNAEVEQWKQWHEHQSNAERELFQP